MNGNSGDYFLNWGGGHSGMQEHNCRKGFGARAPLLSPERNRSANGRLQAREVVPSYRKGNY